MNYYYCQYLCALEYVFIHNLYECLPCFGGSDHLQQPAVQKLIRGDLPRLPPLELSYRTYMNT